MKILLTGATGYVGKRLLPVLLDQGHTVFCLVRDEKRFRSGFKGSDFPETIEWDLLEDPEKIELNIKVDVAYYLIHSMTASVSNFENLENESAGNFLKLCKKINPEQVIYLSGIANDQKLSKHLNSRKNVEDILRKGSFHLTVLRAGIIVGSGSASFEIIRDLVEKLPVMITPKWLNTKSKPIAISDVIRFLTGVAAERFTYDKAYDIGGPEIVTYRQMLLIYAEVRNLRRFIFTLPVMTPRLSSYWLYFVTSVSYPLAVNLVESMKSDVIPSSNNLAEKLNIQPINYKNAIQKAFMKIEQNMIISSWKDSLISSMNDKNLNAHIEVPVHGCIQDKKSIKLKDPDRVLDNLWAIGGERGWYYGNFLWSVRGAMDKVAGGVGLRRGRTNPVEINHGDALDFWRVIYASRESKRLLLFAEMKLPGDAWLEFIIDDDDYLHQIATFRPKGLMGRLYWIFSFPFHLFVFRGMIRNIAKY